MATINMEVLEMFIDIANEFEIANNWTLQMEFHNRMKLLGTKEVTLILIFELISFNNINVTYNTYIVEQN